MPFNEALGTRVGEVTEDGLFETESVSCLGLCDLQPAVMVNLRAARSTGRGEGPQPAGRPARARRLMELVVTKNFGQPGSHGRWRATARRAGTRP